MDLMRDAARLAREHGAFVQTHLAENRREVAEVRRAFPKAPSYTGVYHAAGLLGPRTVLAHSIWLSKAEVGLLKKTGSSVAHCPTSNAFLSSGIMDAGRLRRAGVPVGLGSDVAAGPTLDLFEVMRQAVYGQRLAAAHGLFDAPPAPTPAKAFRMATLGGAEALGWSGRIGTLERGKDADLVLVDPSSYDAGAGPARDAEAAVSRLVYRAGRAAVRAAFVRGRRV